MEIGDFAFTENKALADISDIVSCTNEFMFGEGCFYRCELLGTNNVVQSLPPNTKRIGGRAFAECPYFDVAELPEPVIEIGTAAFAGCWMRSLSAFPTNCPHVASNLFARTSLADTTFLLDNPIMFWDDCFRDERDLETFVLDTFDTTRIVRLPNITCESLESADGFPFGASDTTRFICSDGFIVNVSNDWRSVRKSLEIRFEVGTIYESSYYEYIPPGSSHPITSKWWTTNYLNTIYIQGIKPHNNGLLHIDFGDNTKTNIFADDRVTHTYAATGTYEIAVYGEFNVIGTKNRFVGIEEEQFQTYKASYTDYIHRFFDLAGSTSNTISRIIVLPASKVKEIGESAFDGLGDVEEFVEIMPTVEKIGAYAYRNCTNMSGSVSIPSNVVSLGESAFQACKLISSVTIDSPILTNLPNYVFADCTNLYSLTFSQENNLLSIGDYILQGANFRSQVLDLSLCTNIHSIAGYSVYGATSLNTMVLYKNIDKINADFTGIKKTFKIEFPNYQCEDVWRILEFPHSGLNNKWNLQTSTRLYCLDGEIVANGFHWEVRYGTNRIKVTNIKSNDTYTISHVVSDGMFSIDWGDGTITENISKVANHVSHTYTADWEHTVVRLRSIDGSSITEVAGTPAGLPMVYKEGAAIHTNITEVFLDNSVKNVGDNSFRGYSLMDSFPINSSSTCTNIGNYAFAGCSSLQTFIPPYNSSALSLGSHIIDGCDKLNGYSINLQYGVFPSMQTNTFEGLSSINIYTYLYVENILEKVPQGCLLGGVSIRCRDGEVYYEDGQKKTFLPTIEVIIEVPEKTTISLGFPDAYRKKNVNGFITGPYYLGPPIDWGDPRTDVWSQFMAQDTYSQYYRHAGIYKIRIFAGNMSGNTPILTHDGLSSRSVLNKRREESGYLPLQNGNPPPEPNFPMIYGYEVPINNSIVINMSQKPTVGIPDVSNPARTLPGKFNNGKYDSPDDPKNYTAFVSDMRLVKKIIFNKDSISPGFGDWCFANSQMDHIEVESYGRTLSVGKGCFANSDISDLLGKHVNTSTALDFEFYGCANITNVSTQFGNLYHVGANAFKDSGMASLVGWMDGDTKVFDGAFENTKLTTLEGMPNSIKEIGLFAFRNSQLQTLEGMSTNVTTINVSAFYNTTNLVSTKGLPKKLEKIEGWAFANSSKLKLIELPNSNVNFCYESFLADRADDKYKLGGYAPGTSRHIFAKFPDSDVYAFSPNVVPTDKNKDGTVKVSSGWGPLGLAVTPRKALDITLVCFCNNGVLERFKETIDRISSPLTITEVTVGTSPITPGFFDTYDTRRQLLIDWGDGDCDFYDTDDMIAISNGTKSFKSHTYPESGTYTIKTYGNIKQVATKPIGTSKYAHAFEPSTGINSFRFYSDTCIQSIGHYAFSDSMGATRDVDVENIESPDHSIGKLPLPGNAALFSTTKMKSMPTYPFGTKPSLVHGIDYSSYDVAYNHIRIPAGTTLRYSNKNGTHHQTISISWGDGVHSKKQLLNGQLDHTFSRAGDYMVAVKISSSSTLNRYICGTSSGSDGTRPSLHVVGGECDGTNPYLTSTDLSGITDIGDWAFYGCNNMRAVSQFNTSLKRIGVSAFEGVGIKRFPTISSTASSLTIENGAFKVAPNHLWLHITTPFSKVTIGNDVFNTQKRYGAAMLDVYFNGKISTIRSRSGFPFCSISDEGYGLAHSPFIQTDGWLENSAFHCRFWGLVDWGQQPIGFYIYLRKKSGEGASAVYEWPDEATSGFPF